MEDAYSASKDGNIRFLRSWLDNIENDLNEGDDHGFTPLHWASREGHLPVVEMLLARGAKINSKNDGGDTPLHLAASHNRKDILVKLLQNKATVNIMNEHGNTPLHYGAFWCYEIICLELVSRGALVSQCNKYDETPLDKAKPYLANILKERAKALGQDLSKKPYEDSDDTGSKYTAEFQTLKSKTTGIDPSEIETVEFLGKGVTGELFKGVWNGLPIVAKKLKVRGYHKRIGLLFSEEYPRLRIFSHPNVLPVVGAVTKPQQLTVVSQYMPYGSLYNMLHEGSTIVIDQVQAIRFAMDIAKGMAYLHTLEPLIPRLNLCSTHVLIDEDLTARISMANARFSFQDHTKHSKPQWMAPEMLQNPPETVDQRSADMWSFAIILWELSSREVPFAGLSPMEVGMKIALEGLRPSILPGMSSYLSKLVHLAWNADPAKRPRFDQIIPILQKM